MIGIAQPSSELPWPFSSLLQFLSRPTFSLVATKFYHFLAFIVATENFFVVTQVLPATLDYVATRSFFVSILLVLLFSILSRQGIHLIPVVGRDRNNLCCYRDCVALGYEFRLLCCDMISLSLLDDGNFVATSKHLS